LNCSIRLLALIPHISPIMPPSSGILPSLLSLLPSYTSTTLPTALIHNSESLLAQSRLRASHLKPDEEIARAYACCEIACQKLRAKLRLPAVKVGGQPCKPAVYKKLVTFLGGVLGENDGGTPKTTTPKSGKKRGADGEVKYGSAVADKRGEKLLVTPSKSSRGDTFLGKIKASAQKSTGKEGGGDGEAPKYTMPCIRALCRRFATPLLAPHVYTGTCVVLKLDGLWPENEYEEESAANEESLEEKVTGLLIALYLMTLTLMQTTKMTKSTYQATCAKAVETLAYQPGVKRVEAWIRRVNQQGYASGQDWFASVPKKVFDFDPYADGDNDEEDEEGYEGEASFLDQGDEDDIILAGRRRRKVAKREGEAGSMLEEDDPEGVLLPGLHTMMQDALDFLSEKRTREFEKWTKQFLQNLDRLDKSSSIQAEKTVAVK
jgi:origin recognition complex subunit 6